jgi:hypothetical protein
LAEFLKEQPYRKDNINEAMPRVILFDQFEELFSLYTERWQDREQFFVQLAEVLEDPLLRVVFVIREDFLAQMDPFASILPGRLRMRFHLECLKKDAALLAVKQPLVKNTSRRFASGVDEELVGKLLKTKALNFKGELVEVEGQYVEPVQLQVVCLELWSSLPPDAEEITQKHLQGIGDVEGALKSFYERAIKKAAQEIGLKEAQLRNWCGEELITRMKTRGTVCKDREYTGSISNAAVKVLENQRIVRAEYRAGAHWYELTHDSLIQPILDSNKEWNDAHKDPITDLIIRSAKVWKRSKEEGKEDKDSLLRGKLLTEALKAPKWKRAYPDDLDELVENFLEASQQEENI